MNDAALAIRDAVESLDVMFENKIHKAKQKIEEMEAEYQERRKSLTMALQEVCVHENSWTPHARHSYDYHNNCDDTYYYKICDVCNKRESLNYSQYEEMTECSTDSEQS